MGSLRSDFTRFFQGIGGDPRVGVPLGDGVAPVLDVSGALFGDRYLFGFNPLVAGGASTRATIELVCNVQTKVWMYVADPLSGAVRMTVSDGFPSPSTGLTELATVSISTTTQRRRNILFSGATTAVPTFPFATTDFGATQRTDLQQQPVTPLPLNVGNKLLLQCDTVNVATFFWIVWEESPIIV